MLLVSVIFRKHSVLVYVHMGHKSKPLNYLSLFHAVSVTDAVPYNELYLLNMKILMV